MFALIAVVVAFYRARARVPRCVVQPLPTACSPAPVRARHGLAWAFVRLAAAAADLCRSSGDSRCRDRGVLLPASCRVTARLPDHWLRYRAVRGRVRACDHRGGAATVADQHSAFASPLQVRLKWSYAFYLVHAGSSMPCASLAYSRSRGGTSCGSPPLCIAGRCGRTPSLGGEAVRASDARVEGCARSVLTDRFSRRRSNATSAQRHSRARRAPTPRIRRSGHRSPSYARDLREARR